MTAVNNWLSNQIGSLNRKIAKAIEFRVTLGDILQVLVGCAALLLAVNQLAGTIDNGVQRISAEVSEIVHPADDSNTYTCLRGEVYLFDGKESSFRVIDINENEEYARVEFNLRGDIRQDRLFINRTRIVRIPGQEEGYSFIVTTMRNGTASVVVVAAK